MGALPSPPPSPRGAVPARPRPVHVLSSLGAGGVAPCGAPPGRKPSSLSWSSSFPDLGLSSSALRLIRSSSPLLPLPLDPQELARVIEVVRKALMFAWGAIVVVEVFITVVLMTAVPVMTMVSMMMVEFVGGNWGSGGLGNAIISVDDGTNMMAMVVGIVRAAWTRRSRSEAAKKPNRKSWKQRTDMYMRPFLLDVFFSNRFIHAKVMHRGTSKVITVASTNAKDLRNTLPSLTDNDACRTIGKLIAERSKEADVFAMAYEPRKGEKIEGKLGIVIDTIKENGIIFVQ